MTARDPHVVNRTGGDPALWSDRVWPVLAGALLAGGTIGAVRTYGVIGSALIGCALLLFACATAYSILSDSRVTMRRLVEGTSLSSVAVLAVMGLLLLFPIGGSVALVFTAVSSPPALAKLARLRPRRQPTATSPVRPLSACRDQAAVDRAFAALVAQFNDEPR